MKVYVEFNNGKISRGKDLPKLINLVELPNGFYLSWHGEFWYFISTATQVNSEFIKAEAQIIWCDTDSIQTVNKTKIDDKKLPYWVNSHVENFVEYFNS